MSLIGMLDYSIHAYKGIFVMGIIAMTYQNKALGRALGIMKKPISRRFLIPYISQSLWIQ